MLLLSCYGPVWAVCHPQVNWSRPQFVIGYGSLIYAPSKQKTLAKSGPNYPVFVQGYQRSWLVRGYLLARPTTFLGVEPRNNAWMNAVVFQIHHQADLHNLDSREKGYCRVEVASQRMTFPRVSPRLHQAQYWIYLPQEKIKYYASSQYPMSIYYANIFLSGCQDIGNKFHLPDFVQQCFSSTHAWPSQHDAYYPTDALPVSRQLFSRFYRDFLDQKSHKISDNILQDK